MSYWVTKGGERWPITPVRHQRGEKTRTWCLNLAFPSKENAIDAALGYIRDHAPYEEIAVEDEHGTVVWTTIVDGLTRMLAAQKLLPATQPEGEQVQPDLENPLLIPRTALVERLQENLDEETKQRETVEAKERQARLAVTQFITDHEDEIVEWIGKGGPWGRGSWEETAKTMERFFTDNDYKPARNRKSSRENELEKFVRVLSMATNETVEVTPRQELYDLL